MVSRVLVSVAYAISVERSHLSNGPFTNSDSVDWNHSNSVQKRHDAAELAYFLSSFSYGGDGEVKRIIGSLNRKPKLARDEFFTYLMNLGEGSDSEFREEVSEQIDKDLNRLSVDLSYNLNLVAGENLKKTMRWVLTAFSNFLRLNPIYDDKNRKGEDVFLNEYKQGMHTAAFAIVLQDLLPRITEGSGGLRKVLGSIDFEGDVFPRVVASMKNTMGLEEIGYESMALDSDSFCADVLTVFEKLRICETEFCPPESHFPILHAISKKCVLEKEDSVLLLAGLTEDVMSEAAAVAQAVSKDFATELQNILRTNVNKIPQDLLAQRDNSLSVVIECDADSASELAEDARFQAREAFYELLYVMYEGDLVYGWITSNQKRGAQTPKVCGACKNGDGRRVKCCVERAKGPLPTWSKDIQLLSFYIGRAREVAGSRLQASAMGMQRGHANPFTLIGRDALSFEEKFDFLFSSLSSHPGESSSTSDGSDSDPSDVEEL